MAKTYPNQQLGATEIIVIVGLTIIAKGNDDLYGQIVGAKRFR